MRLMRALSGVVLLALGLLTFLVGAGVAHAAPPAVVDDAGLLTPAEERVLTGRINEIRQRYDYDVLIRTVYFFDGATVAQANENFYTDQGYGLGAGRDGISFLVAFSSRDADLWATPGRGHIVFTDYGREYIRDRMLPAMGQNEFNEAFTIFLAQVDDFLAEAETGRPYDVDHHVPNPNRLLYSVLIGVGVGVVVALFSVMAMKRALKTVRPQHAAQAYVSSGPDFDIRTDQFVSTNTTRTARPQNNSSSSFSGGGGGGSSGGGHTSFKF